MTKQEKLSLYLQAKEAYYNGQEIMTDYEFDALEKELGLENKSEVGAKHNPSYTVKHPYIMGSLSKVQIHKDKDGNIDWNKYAQEVWKYVWKDVKCIITPKYDGCSFEIYVKNNNVSISSRGDGNWGKDLKQHLIKLLPVKLFNLAEEFTLRGEVLVRKSVFEKKYSEQFTNPRSFVSGVLNNDYSEDKEFQNKLHDLSLVIYDYRIYNDGIWEDYDWTEIMYRINEDSSFFTDDMMEISELLPKFKIIDYTNYFETIYSKFDAFRQLSEFALDGFVIKPLQEMRINNVNERRPKDCVAIKFIPMLEETEVTNITWQLGKTHEYTPIIWVNPVEMDGRMVQKCSGHNLGYLRHKGITVGAKIIMSLAGDIIPFMYKVTKENPDGEIPMPTDHEYFEDNIHLMAILSEKDKCRYKFLNSVEYLNIPTLGPESAKQLFEYLSKTDEVTNEFFGESDKVIPNNILMISPEEVYFGLGCGKLAENASKAYKKVLKELTLTDIIKSCCFKFCGDKVASQVVNYLMGSDYDFSHLASEGYSWVFDKNSEQYRELTALLDSMGKTIDDFKVIHETIQNTSSNQIPIIMTGEPNNYSTKAEFLKCHPEYRNTGSWKEVQIVFTNSLESNTGKMKKAREKGIRIELY